MTIPSTARKAGPLLGTGAQTSWPFTFKVFAENDVAVTTANSTGVETVLVLNTDYSVALNANQETSPGGTVTYPISGTPLPVGSKLSIVGDIDYDQPLDLPSGGNFSPLALENQLDRTIMQVQQLREVTDRAVLIPVTSTASGVLPAPEASKVIGWNLTETGLVNVDAASLASVTASAYVVVDKFTGDGTTTQFVCSQLPGSTNAAEVTIAGIMQNPAVDYTVSGARVVFTSAPTNGTVIIVRFLVAASQSSGSAFITERHVATSGQTAFTLANAYAPGAETLSVFVNGLLMSSALDYAETSANVVTFTSGLTLNDEAVFHIWRTNSIGVADSVNVSYAPAGTGAVATTVQSKLRESVSVADYADFASYVAASSDGGFFNDDATPGISTRARDRLFVGDSARYTGNRLGANGYGSSWITEHAASYLVKNATFAASCEADVNRIGILGASRTEPGETSSVNMGVAALTLNEGVSTSSRASYVEAMHKTSVGGATAGVEIQVGNYTGRTPVANAYSMGNVEVLGLYIGAEGGVGYTVGDSDTPITPAANPAGAAIDIAGGSLNSAAQKWVVGVVFRSGALTRDGSDFATAISLAQKHTIKWEIGASDTGASIWSEVTVNSQRVGIKFENRRVRLLGDGDRILLDTLDDTAGAGAVNYPLLGNGRTGIAPLLSADGSDTNVSLEIRTKGTGVTRLTSHAGSGENLRITPPATAPVDYMTIAGSATGALATLGCAGTSTNIDIRILPKGAGYVRFGAFTANADAAVNGYVTIRTDDGVLRKLATIA